MSFFFSFFLRDIITKVWYRIIKKSERWGSLYQRRNSFVVHNFGAQPASGFGIVHELRLHHRHHGAVVLVVLPPLLLLVKNSPSSPPPLYLAITTTSLLSPPFQSLEENDVCYQPQSCRFETPATRSSVTFWPPLELEATSTRSNSSIALISCYFIHIISEYIISMWLYFNCLE